MKRKSVKLIYGLSGNPISYTINIDSMIKSMDIQTTKNNILNIKTAMILNKIEKKRLKREMKLALKKLTELT